jgi:hypothetical protein
MQHLLRKKKMFGTAAKKNLYYIHDRQFAMAGLETKKKKKKQYRYI